MKMHSLFSLTAAAGCLLFGCGAEADDYVAGAQYSCTAAIGTFELVPYVQPDGASDFPFKEGFTTLTNESSNFKCRLGKRILRAQIEVTPPQPRGMCMGGGAVSVMSLVVDGVELLDKSLPFNYGCFGDTALVKVLVRTKGKMVELEQCTAPKVGGPIEPLKCSVKTFDVDAISAANAQADRPPVDADAQLRQSAARLPPENDLARVFPATLSKSNAPLCAHWYSLFLNSLVAQDKQTYGWIAGKKGERIYIRRTNPSFCRNTADDGCAARAYVIPGDRVDVGFICGDWTYVQYRSRIKSQPSTRGWVETARVYGVTPTVSERTVASASPTLSEQTQKDALLQALAMKDVVAAERLIAAGANLNGAENSGEPLVAAIQSGSVAVVQALIRLGATVNPEPAKAVFKCRVLSVALDNPEMFDALVKAGIDLNCRSGHLGSTQLMEISGYNRLLFWDPIRIGPPNSYGPLRDPLAIAKRLINAGADVNARDAHGRTALIYTLDANNIDVSELLLERGADPNISVDAINDSSAEQLGSTPLMAAFGAYSVTRDPSMVELLLAHGANPNYRNLSKYDQQWDETTSGAVTFAGQTALTRAAADGYYTLVRLLLENGADPLIPREDGMLPEAIARQKKRASIAALIANHGAKPK